MKKNSILITVILIVSGIAAYLIYDKVFNPVSKRVAGRFSENLFLLQHDYAYKVTAETEDGPTSIYLVKNRGNEFDVWEPGNTGNRLFATALMMDSSGICITSGYAAEPWKNDDDISSIRKLFASQTGIDEQDIRVSGRTIRMTIQPVSQIGTGRASEFEYVQYTKGSEQPDELAFIGRKDNKQKLPFKELDLGSNYPQYREKEKDLFVLSIPVYDYSAALPITPAVTIVTSRGEDNSGTFFTNPSIAIAEGSPVFDAKLNLVGVYTSVSRSRRQYYVSHFVRTFVSPSIIPQSIIASSVLIDSIPQIPGEIKIPEFAAPQYVHFDFPFVAEEGWTMLEERTSENDEIPDDADQGVRNFATSPFAFNRQKARFRIKIEGEGPVDVGLVTDKMGFLQVDYSEKLRSSKTVDLGILEGSYTMSVFHDTKTKVRLVFERFE